MICVIMRYFEKKRRIIMSNEVGSRLKEMRQRLKMTQQQLGEKLGINGSAVAKHENGITFPTGKILNILASQYNVSMDYLVCGRGTLFYEVVAPKLAKIGIAVSRHSILKLWHCWFKPELSDFCGD
jgi:transcriptional regulator with XRE-family HTH domain